MNARVPRITAAVLALAVNVVLLTALITPGRGSGGFPAEPPERVLVFFADATPSVHEPLLKRVRHERQRPVGAPVPHEILSVPLATGPPTETLASVTQKVVPDRDATVINSPGLRDTCQRTYPGEFTSEQAEEAGLVLRVFVMADGRIGQGTVTRSSGDEHLDWITLKCVQAYAQLQPAMDAEAPIGSWQRLTWHWSQP